jgi:hypothetical protein
VRGTSGSRARLRGVWSNLYGFEPHPRHFLFRINSLQELLILFLCLVKMARGGIVVGMVYFSFFSVELVELYPAANRAA